jgi:hypothetical protein
VLSGLDNPFGVAIQPGTGDVFVSDSGAGRVIRVVSGQSRDVITGFATADCGPEPKYRLGPLGLTFINRQTLVVGEAGRPDGEDILHVFELPLEDAAPVAADSGTAIGPVPTQNATPGSGNFFSVVFSKGALFATSAGESDPGSLTRASVNSPSSFGPLVRFSQVKSATPFRPIGLTVSPRDELVVGHIGEFGNERDSTLIFFSESDGKPLLNLKTGLLDIVAVAYGPKKQGATRSHLYALDFAWQAPDEGGLFRLDAKRLADGTQEAQPVKLSSLDRPTAMAFADDGTLYVTVVGTASDSTQKSGKLLRFAAGL